MAVDPQSIFVTLLAPPALIINVIPQGPNYAAATGLTAALASTAPGQGASLLFDTNGANQHMLNQGQLSILGFMTPTQYAAWQASQTIYDMTAILQAAIAAVSVTTGRLTLVRGTYMISTPLVCNTTGVQIVGEGAWSTIIQASAAWAGDGLIVLGTKTVGSYLETTHLVLANVSVDCNQKANLGVECYGLRDTSKLESVYVRNFLKSGIYTDFTGAGAYPHVGDYNAQSTMNQGLLILNCIALGQNSGALNGATFISLNGIYESTLINTKALGYDNVNQTNCIGIAFGPTQFNGVNPTSATGVRLYNCSVGGINDDGLIPAHSTNLSIKYLNANNCSDEFTTHETVTGPLYFFSATAVYCKGVNPRVYNPAASAFVFPSLVTFDANVYDCFLEHVSIWPSTGTAVVAGDIVFKGHGCGVQIDTCAFDVTAPASVVTFSAGAWNWVEGRGGTGTSFKTRFRYSSESDNQLASVANTNSPITETIDQYGRTIQLPSPAGSVKIKHYDIDGSGTIFGNKQWMYQAVSSFTGTVSGSVLTLNSAASSGFALGAALSGAGLSASLVSTLASGTLGANGSTYNLSASPGNVGPIAMTALSNIFGLQEGIIFMNVSAIPTALAGAAVGQVWCDTTSANVLKLRIV